MNCPGCGNEVFAGDPFCENCGADLRNMQVPPPAAPPAAPPPAPAEPPPPAAATPIPPAVQEAFPAQQHAAPVQAAPAAPLPVAPPPVAVPSAPPAAVSPPPAPPASAPPAAPRPAGVGPRLIVKESGDAFALPRGRDAAVGRTDPIDGIFPDVDLTPHDALTGVSRRHALLHEQGGQWFIRDLNSTNYTIVNRQRLQPDQDFLIEPGDEIRFGRVVMIFQV